MIQKNLLFSGLLLIPCSAAACGSCTFSMIEYYWPHVMYWSFGMMVWLWALLLVIDSEDKKILFSNSNIAILLFIMVSFVMGFVVFGPFSFIPLGLLAFDTSVKSFLPHIRQKISARSKRGLKIVSIAAFFCMAAGFMISTHTKNTRSDVEFILTWKGTHMSRSVLHRLLLDHQKNKDDLQQIFSASNKKYLIKMLNDDEIDKEKIFEAIIYEDLL